MEGSGKTLIICEISPKYQFQGPRYRDLGDASGQEFREDCLIPWLDSLNNNSAAVIDFVGTRAFSPSFLEEGFGGAIRLNKGYKDKLIRVSFKNIDQIWLKLLQKYIQEA